MSTIGALEDRDSDQPHWRKRWPGRACMYIALQTAEGSLIRSEIPLTSDQVKTILKILAL